MRLPSIAGSLIEITSKEKDNVARVLRDLRRSRQSYVPTGVMFEKQENGELAGRAFFEPDTPDGARKLKIAWQGHCVEIEL